VQERLDDVRKIDMAIAQSDSPPIKLYRKCEVSEEFNGIEKAELGKVFTLDAYESTTISEKAATDFKAEVKNREVIEILFPGGRGGGVFMTGNTDWEDEFEFLLKRGSKLSIVKKPDDINNIYMFEVLP
jgi:hypothetical protein